jgi:anti-sigma regulatory factor (Ser/Thr protein kinase)
MQKSTAGISAVATERTGREAASIERTLEPTATWEGWRPRGADAIWRAFPAELAYGSAIRQAIQCAAIDRRISPEDTADLVLAVSEAFTNAVRHGNCRPGDCVWLAIQWLPSAVAIRMRYPGEQFEVHDPVLPPVGSQQGRGRYIMSRLLDSVEYRFEGPWTELRLARRFQQASRANRD